jgi:hypothetical protein
MARSVFSTLDLSQVIVSLLFSVLKDRILQSVQHSPSSRTFSVLQRTCGSADVPEKGNLRVPLNLDHVKTVIYALANFVWYYFF